MSIGVRLDEDDDEIDVAVSYEKGLVINAVLAIGLVLLVLAVRMFFSG